MTQWNFLDIILILAVAVPMGIGVFRGLIRSVLGLMGTLAGLGLAIPFSRPLGNAITGFLDLESYFTGRVSAFIVIYLGCWSLALILSFLLRSILSKMKLRWVDRLMGAGLGILKGAVIVTVILILFDVMPTLKPYLDNSLLASPIVRSAKTASMHLPAPWQAYLNPDRWIGVSRKKSLDTVIRHGMKTPPPTPKPKKTE